MGALWGGLAFSMEDDFLFPTVMECGRDSYTGLLSSLPRTLSMAVRQGSPGRGGKRHFADNFFIATSRSGLMLPGL